MTEQQQAAIVALSHAVAERPFPPSLVGLLPTYCLCMIIRFHYLDEFYVFFSFLMRDHQAQEKVAGLENGLSISTKHSTAEDSGAIEAVLVNTNQVSSISIDYCVPLVF